ncbi:MAG: hypothetical protein DBX45_05715 [Oscillospiraceae bacterium]|nr:MAG: hypothetical protein DBX45_05715 [Oscillospiraceae bacterium]
MRHLKAHFFYRPLCLDGIVVRYLGGEYGTARNYLIGERFDCIAHVLERTFSRAELVRLYSRLKNIRLELLSGLRALVILEHAVHALEQLADVDIILVSEYRLGCLGAERFFGLCALLITYIGIITVKSADVVSGGFYLRWVIQHVYNTIVYTLIAILNYNSVVISAQILAINGFCVAVKV